MSGACEVSSWVAAEGGSPSDSALLCAEAVGGWEALSGIVAGGGSPLDSMLLHAEEGGGGDPLTMKVGHAVAPAEPFGDADASAPIGPTVSYLVVRAWAKPPRSLNVWLKMFVVNLVV